VGHETDTTIADFVADLRVATPTEAAKKACFSMADTKDELYRREEEFDYRMNDILHRKRMQVEKYGEMIKSFSPEEKLKALRERMTYLESTINQRMQYALEGARQKISSLAGLLDAASPAKRLSGGYSFVTTSKGMRLTEASQVEVGDEISLFLQKGVLKANVIEKVKED
jgi:exodeoxyribonuclease VII large subunit